MDVSDTKLTGKQEVIKNYETLKFPRAVKQEKNNLFKGYTSPQLVVPAKVKVEAWKIYKKRAKFPLQG